MYVDERRMVRQRQAARGERSKPAVIEAPEIEQRKQNPQLKNKQPGGGQRTRERETQQIKPAAAKEKISEPTGSRRKFFL